MSDQLVLDRPSARRLSPTAWRRLEVQGLRGSAEEIAEIYPWHRLAYGLCGSIVVLGTLTVSSGVLWPLALVAVIGASSPVHPFDLIYNHGIRFLRGTGKLPLRGAPTRFACGMASVWLVSAAWSFDHGFTAMGMGFGLSMAVMAILATTTDICLPSMTYRALFSPLPPDPETL